MKKLSKLLLVIIIATMILPIGLVYAEPDETPTEEAVEGEADTEEAVEEGEEGFTDTTNEATEEEIDEELKKIQEELDRQDKQDQERYTPEEGVEKPDQSQREKEIIKTPMDTPASVTGEKYKGSGTVVDFTTTGSKAFYTVKAPDHSVFYIVIDMDKTEDNVYFLSEINGEELSLTDVTTPTEKPRPTPKPVEEEKKESNSFLIILGVGSIGFLAYHIFYGRLKDFNPLNKKKKKEEKTDEEFERDPTNVHGEEDLKDEIINDLSEEDDK